MNIYDTKYFYYYWILYQYLNTKTTIIITYTHPLLAIPPYLSELHNLSTLRIIKIFIDTLVIGMGGLNVPNQKQQQK